MNLNCPNIQYVREHMRQDINFERWPQQCCWWWWEGDKTLLAGEMWQIACKELSRNSEEEIYRVVRRRLQTWQAQKNQLIEAMHSDSSDIDQPCIFTQPHTDGKRLLPGFSTLKHWNSSEETYRRTLFLTFSSVPVLCSLTTLHGWSILLCATIRGCCHV